MTASSDSFQEFLDGVPTGSDPDVEAAIKTLRDFASRNGHEALKEKFEELIVGSEGDKFVKNLAGDLANLSGLKVKEEYESIKGIWQRTMMPVWNSTKDAFLSRDGFQILGSSLSLAGRTWEGLSEFWDKVQKEHPIIKYADKPVKAFAVVLYIKGAPVIGAIKASELVGRSAEEYGKTRKLWHSIKKGCKDTANSIYHHFLRLTIGNNVKPAMEEFYKQLGIDQSSAKQFIRAVKSYDQMHQLDELGIVGAGNSAKNVTKIAEELAKNNPNLAKDSKNAIDIGLISGIVIPATLKGLDYKKMLEISSAAVKPDIAKKLSNFPPSIKSFAMDRIVQYSIDNPFKNIEDVISRSFDALSNSKNTNIGINAFGHYLKKQSPDLYSKFSSVLQGISKGSAGLEEFGKMLQESPEYKKLNKKDKAEIQKFVADYAVEDILQNVLEKSAERGAKRPDSLKPRKASFRERFSDFFSRKKKTGFVKSLEESRKGSKKGKSTSLDQK